MFTALQNHSPSPQVPRSYWWKTHPSVPYVADLSTRPKSGLIRKNVPNVSIWGFGLLLSAPRDERPLGWNHPQASKWLLGTQEVPSSWPHDKTFPSLDWSLGYVWAWQVGQLLSFWILRTPTLSLLSFPDPSWICIVLGITSKLTSWYFTPPLYCLSSSLNASLRLRYFA